MPTPLRPVRPPTASLVGGAVAWTTIAWLVGFLTWSAVAPPFEATWAHLVDDAAVVPLRVAIAWIALHLARSPETTDAARRGWLLLGWSFVISAATSSVRLLVTAGLPLPTGWGLVPSLPQVALMLAGLWSLARLRRERGRAADWFDAGVIIVACFLLASHFITGGNPFVPAQLGAVRWLFLLYLCADVVAVQLAATTWFRKPEGLSQVMLGLLTFGFAAISVADLLIDREIRAGTWTNGGLADALVATGFALIVIGLDAQRRRAALSHLPRTELAPGRHVVGPIAVVAAMVPLVQLAWDESHDRGEMAFLVTGMAVLLALVLARQVLALRYAEEQARSRTEADLRFRSLVQRSSDAIFQLTPAQAIEWASPSAGELTGSIPALLKGRPIAELAHPEDRDRLRVFLANAGEPFSRNAALRWRMGRTDRWHDVESVVSDLSPDGGTRSLVLNTRNITERVRLEQQLRQAQKLEAVGRLAGGIAHDFNNILAAIITHAQLVRDMIPADDERARDLLEIEQTAQRGAVLTRRLLSFSRPELGEQHAQQLSVVLKGMEPMLRRLLVGQVELALVLGEDDLWVRTADGQIEQILMNLAINARDAMPDGGVVRISTALLVVRPGDTGRVRIPGVLPGRWAELVVRDEGVGMDAHTLANLFEPFFTTKPSGLGTGLGLTTVRGIVRSLGGHVHAESAPGKGTTMRVLLPLAASETPAPAEEPAPPSSVLGRPRVLIVDDEISLRRGMERYLGRHGYDAVGAPSAVDGLALLEEMGWRVDLILTDMVMPRMGGREFVRRVRERLPGVPVICMSGHMEWEADDQEDREAPWTPDRLLAKPFTFNELLQRVQLALDPSATGTAP
ncbi:MAG: response regulator [Gemmatimonadales bacterium]|nr:response regulator [Gemmatimonadota bacterium]MCL4213636.1 response regulator [Gemmatimonadales bacterium]